MTVEPLVNHKDAIPTLVKWYESEWKPYYGINGPGDAQTDLISRCKDTIPMGLIAIENGDVLGTAAIDKDVATNLTPSIVGLLVAPEYRRRGIATSLISAAEKWASQLKYRKLYVSTTVLGNMLQNLGWTQIDEVEFINAEYGSVYMRKL